jgi:tetratricopeptide (TPR) repeat protein
VPDEGRTTNQISQGLFLSTVIQGRDITLQLPAEITPAMGALPAGNPAFAGRESDLEILLDALKPLENQLLPLEATAASGALLTAMDGLAGIGKTELAVQAARIALSRGWFPGGVLFVDLFGYDPARRLTAGQALEGFLRALAIPGEQIPPQSQDQARLYTSLLAAYAREKRRILVVIDGASSVDQAKPLLPADAVNAAIVTSRDKLGLTGARLINLGVLEPESAVAMLDKVLSIAKPDDVRVRENPGDARRVADLCGYLPLALAIAAALLAEDPERPLEAIAHDLQSEHTRLDELKYGDIAVRAAFDLSYRRLAPGNARLFRLLSVNPGPDIGTSTAVVLGATENAAIFRGFKELTDTTPLTSRNFFLHLESLMENDRAITRRGLEALARAHLIERGGRYGRWQMHDLIRLFATDHSLRRAKQDKRAQVTSLLLAYYLSGTRAASTYLDFTTPEPPATYGFSDEERALEWLDTEYANLVAAVRAANGTHAFIALNLSLSLVYIITIRGRYNDAITLSPIAIRAARQLRDKHGEGVVLRNLGIAQMEVGSFAKAIASYRGSLRMYRETGDKVGEGTVLANLGGALAKVGKLDEAILNLQEALQIDRMVGSRYSEGVALINLGTALEKAGEIEQAISAFQDAAKIQFEVGDQRARARALDNLGIVFEQNGRPDEAITQYRIATKIYRFIGDQLGEAKVLAHSAEAFLKAGQSDKAIRVLQDAAQIYRDIADKHGEEDIMDRLRTMRQGLAITFNEQGAL